MAEMPLLSLCLVYFALFGGSSFVFGNDEAASVENRLDQIQSSLNVIFVEASEQIEALTKEVRTLKQSLDHVGWYSEDVKHSVASIEENSDLLMRNLTILTYRSDEIIANQQYCANHEALKNLFYDLTPKCGSTSKHPQVVNGSCSNAPSRSGVYQMAVSASAASFKAYCEMDLFGGGWTVIQKRQDGSVDFNRSWAEYREGFGEASGEYWLGLETMHQMTTRKPHELLITFESFNGSTSYVRYAGVVIDSGQQKYKIFLNSSGYGNAFDSLYNYRGEDFATPDVQSSTYIGCARALASGFWHADCSTATYSNNLNGIYGGTARRNGMWWYKSFSGYQHYEPLKGSRMMIREKLV